MSLPVPPPPPPPPPPPSSQRSIHYLELPSDLKWSSKSRSTKKNTRGQEVQKSSSSSKQKFVSTKASVVVSRQSTLENSNIVGWPHGNLTKLPSKSSSGGSSSLYPNINTTTNSVSNSSLKRTSSPFHHKIKIPGSTKEMDSSSINRFPSGCSAGDVNKEMVIDKIVELLEEKISISETHKEKKDEKENSEQDKKGSKDGNPTKTYAQSLKKTHQKVKENRKKMQMPDEEYKSVDVLDRGKFDAVNDSNWNFRTRKLHKNSQILNLEKNVTSPTKDQEWSAHENEEKKGKIAEESGDEKNKSKEHKEEKKKKKNKNKKKNKKGKEKNKEKEPDKEPQIEIHLPKFSLQLTPQEIADDLFSMTGRRPSRKLKKRTKNVQRQVEQLTPGLWLESIEADRYKVNKNIRKVVLGNTHSTNPNNQPEVISTLALVHQFLGTTGVSVISGTITVTALKKRPAEGVRWYNSDVPELDATFEYLKVARRVKFPKNYKH
ncbi:hypothetical protein ACH5RR_000585 [Cinchona calisaya]|uniref:Uncharacterized protein n=1 Tax=Cinchona calisaya TaxID=153742 RepID=A0ABD3B171_9GENT